MSVSLSDSWSWILELNGLAGFPKFSMVLDFNTGLRGSLLIISPAGRADSR